MLSFIYIPTLLSWSVVDAIMDIKKTYDVKKNWQGDPCLPKDYTWEGLRCNYSSSSSTRIIGLYVSNTCII